MTQEIFPAIMAIRDLEGTTRENPSRQLEGRKHHEQTDIWPGGHSGGRAGRQRRLGGAMRGRRRPEIQRAGELLLSNLFKRDHYPDRAASDNWLRFSFPFWFPDLISYRLGNMQAFQVISTQPAVAKVIVYAAHPRQGLVYELMSFDNIGGQIF